VKRIAWILLVVPALAACDETKSAAPVQGSKPAVGTKPTDQPDRVSVKHILIAYKGAERSKATRTKQEAKELAKTVFMHASNGAPIEELMQQYSDDEGARNGRSYEMANHGVATTGAEEFARSGMSIAFGDVSFKLAVNEVGMTDPDTMDSKFGYHIIKRIK
jgi:peptidyl-prolyl cis-trans isomerase D